MAIQAAAHPAHQAGHEEGLSRGMAGMVLFIASEIMLFGGLFAAYFFERSRNQANEWPPAGVHELEWFPLALILTIILVLSGLVAHFGVVAAKSGNRQGLTLAMAVAIVMGTVFIIGQSFEWFSLMDEGLTAKSGVYGSTFFIMTGFHGAHVIAGIALLVVVFVRSLWVDFTPTRHLIVDASVLYWHFVDLVWVFLYAVLYLT